MLTHLDLFSGIGGLSLAAEWAGFKTIGFVENDEYCQKVLKKHWPDVPIVEDIRDVEGIKNVANATSIRCFAGGDNRKERYIQANQGTTEESQSTGARWFGGISKIGADAGYDYRESAESPITLITGGFPCQSFSVAGKRRGKEDDRYLWPEMFRIIAEVRPRWVLAENVTGIIGMALDTVLSDLERAGYTCEAVVIPACAVNAPHRRDRIWIMAYGSGNRSKTRQSRQEQGQEGNTAKPINESQDVADTTDRSNQRGSAQCDVGRFQDQVLRESWNPDEWAVEPKLGRVAHGIPHRVDRLRCLGNAVVSQVAYEILRGIAEIEQV